MPIPGHFEDLPSAPGRPRETRRQLQLEAEGALPSGDAARVLIHNVSASGLLIETTVTLHEGERIEIALPGAGPAPAAVIWSSGALYGCRFKTPLSPGVLSALQLRSDAAPSPAPAATPAPAPPTARRQGPPGSPRG